ncbi:hypothetical protein A2U01_0076428, partial [Trifolium medium]|nr:hypothetical protein [Trifolium medium]
MVNDEEGEFVGEDSERWRRVKNDGELSRGVKKMKKGSDSIK